MGSTRVNLSTPAMRGYDPGRSFAVRVLWLLVEAAVFLNPVVTSYRLKRVILRRFGAEVGAGLVIKPGVHIKCPWRLRLGEHVWLGERAWIDNVADVVIGSHVVVSQGAYLCTGNHDWTDARMGLDARRIVLEDGSWIAAFACVAPGVTVATEAIVTLGSTLVCDARPRGIYQGNPAMPIGTREFAA